jgi:hypothetical protein
MEGVLTQPEGSITNQDGITQTGATQVEITQAGITQIGITQAGTNQTGTGTIQAQAGITQVETTQADITQIGITQAGTTRTGDALPAVPLPPVEAGETPYIITQAVPEDLSLDWSTPPARLVAPGQGGTRQSTVLSGDFSDFQGLTASLPEPVVPQKVNQPSNPPAPKETVIQGEAAVPGIQLLPPEMELTVLPPATAPVGPGEGADSSQPTEVAEAVVSPGTTVATVERGPDSLPGKTGTTQPSFDHLVETARETIADLSLRAQQQGKAEVRLRLYPENLGHLTVRVAAEGAKVHVQLAVDSPRTQMLLDQSMGQLRSSLADLGLQLGETSVSLNHSGYGSRQETGPGGHQPRSYYSHRSEGSGEGPEATPRQGLVDIWA